MKNSSRGARKQKRINKQVSLEDVRMDAIISKVIRNAKQDYTREVYGDDPIYYNSLMRRL